MSAKNKLKSIVSSFIKLSLSDHKLIEERLETRFLRKGEFLMKEGEFNRCIGFMEDGLMRSFFVDQKGNEVTAGFFQNYSFCTDLNSFQTGGKCQRSIEALTNCHLLILNRTRQQELRAEIKQWSYFEQHYIAEMLMKKLQFQRKIANSSAADAYQFFMEYYQQAAAYAPRYQIASFLGISPFTLSRVQNRS